MSVWGRVRAGARAAFTVENITAQLVWVGVSLLVTTVIGVRYDLPWWGWLLVGFSALLIVGAVILKLRQPTPLEPAGAFGPPPKTVQEEVRDRLWGPRSDDVTTLTDPDLRAEADRLAKELRRFREQHAKALPPLDWVVVPGEPEKLEQFKECREADAIETYQRTFEERVAAVYEELVRRRGYGHPMMDGRYDNIRMAGEIDTVAHALEDMANPEPDRPERRDD